MNLNIYAVYDQKSYTYSMPLVFQNDEIAIRFFIRQLMSDMDQDYVEFAEDYYIERVGYWNNDSGDIQKAEDRERIITMSAIVARIRRAKKRANDVPEAQSIVDHSPLNTQVGNGSQNQ